jgi:hypothetical protein
MAKLNTEKSINVGFLNNSLTLAIIVMVLGLDFPNCTGDAKLSRVDRMPLNFP